MAGRMSTFQKRADKLLRAHGWEKERYTAKGYIMYRNIRTGETTTVSSSPKNESDALKQVRKFAGIKG